MVDHIEIPGQATIVDLLRALKGDVQKRYKAQLVGICGSQARGDATKDSDVDILVDFLEGATLLDLSGLGDFLEEQLNQKVDVISRRAIREEIKASVYNDLIHL